MPNTLPQVYPQSNLGSVVNKMLNHSNANALNKSSDFQIIRDGRGTFIKLASEHKRFPSAFMEYKGEYDPDAYYSVDDVIRVMHDTNYSNTDAEETLKVTPGVWVCVAEVPDFLVSRTLISHGVTLSQYVRRQNIDYFPKWPEPTATRDDVKDSTNDYTQHNIRYWELLSLLPVETHLCVNGEDSIYYVGAMKSGSYTN